MIDRYIQFVRRFLPSPFSIALVLTVLSFVIVFALNISQGIGTLSDSLNWWAEGLWTPSLLVFAMQMMLMLVLGHVLALTPAINRLIGKIVNLANTTATAAALVCLSSLIVGLFNWGLGLIFGAILARKMGESFSLKKKPLNYALIGAAGYSALMIWHGGISGSAVIKVAESGNLDTLMSGILNEQQISLLPDRIGLEETVFSIKNILTSIAIIICLPLTLFFVGRAGNHSQLLSIHPIATKNPVRTEESIKGAEHLDHSSYPGKIAGVFILALCMELSFGSGKLLEFFTPNNINLLLLGLCLLLHRNIYSLLHAADNAITGATGILLQFPLYFGIMGLFKSSGIIESFSSYFASISNEQTFPIFTYLSAGIVNVFVPSGGGQWVIQGPILVKAALELNIPLSKSIMALAYGDQITNMLQPFWALPLLGITKLTAKDILPYTLVMFSVGFIIYLVSVSI